MILLYTLNPYISVLYGLIRRDMYIRWGLIHGRYYINLKIYLLSFVETPRKFIIAELSIRKLGSSSVLIILLLLLILLLALMKIRAYGSKALQ